MKNYLIAETYGLGDKLYTDSLVKELLSRADTGKVAMLVSKAGGSLRMPFYGERVELLPMEFAWNRRRAQRNPLRLLRSIFAPRIAFGSRFSGYVGLCPRGDLWQRLILRLLGAAPIISYGYSRGEGFLERILGRSREPVMEARISFARQIAPDILPKPGFLRDTSAPARRGEVFLAPEASDPKRELEESKWVQISRELRKNGWKTVLVVHANTAGKFRGVFGGCRPSGSGFDKARAGRRVRGGGGLVHGASARRVRGGSRLDIRAAAPRRVGSRGGAQAGGV